MRSFVAAALAVVLAGFATLSFSAEIPLNQAQYDATRAAGKPIAVIFQADWSSACPGKARHPHS